MAVSYKKLWQLLIGHDLKKKDLVHKIGVSQYSVTKMSKGENISTDVLVKICEAFHCKIEDIMEVVPSKDDEK